MKKAAQHNHIKIVLFIDICGGLNAVLAKASRWLTATPAPPAVTLKLNLITKTVVAKSAWMKPCI